VSAQRKALIIANDEYEHEGLGRLLAPAADAQALAAVLGDAQVGDFDVQVVRNEPAHVIQAEVEELFSEARPDDILLLHFSCHGLKNESGELFFAAANTRLNRLASTAVSADFVQRCMRASRCRSVVLLLDCCYGGAFAQGVTVRAAGDVDVLGSFPHERARSGRGRAVISASSAMEYAFEGDRLADDAAPRPSVFTTALVEGLETGDADRDQDGWVSLDELYDYVFDMVRERNPHQTPSRDVEMQGDLFIARRRNVVTTPAELSPELVQAIDSPLAGIRTGAVQELGRVLGGGHAGRALAARLALEELAEDDSRQVSAAATAVLRSTQPAPPPGLPAVDEPEIAEAPASRPAPEELASVPEEPAVAADRPAAVRKVPVLPEAAAEAEAPAGRPWLVAAGLLSVVEAIGLIVVLFVQVDANSTFRLISSDANSEQLAFGAAVFLAVGICLLIPRASGLVGTGLILGTAATVPADFAVLIVASHQHPFSTVGAVLLFGTEALAVASPALAGLGLWRAGTVRVQLRSLVGRGPARAGSWLVIALGVAGAVSYAIQVGGADNVPGLDADITITDQLAVPLVWLTLMAVAVPVIAAAARPRLFGTALLGGWICVALGEVPVLTDPKTGVFGYTLIALAFALIPFARTPAPELDEPITLAR
jgi:caspase domain-containing protein